MDPNGQRRQGFDCDLFSESERLLLWKIPHIPNSMNITQTLTSFLIALLACSFVYSGDSEPILTRSGRGSTRPGDRTSQHRPLGAEFAQVEKPDAQQPKGKDAKATLLSAADKLKSYASVRANITEKVSIQTRSFTAKGSYLQGQNLQLRMEFTVELGGVKGSLLEVCDGQVLWTRHDLGEKDQTQITRRDVRQILQAAEQAGQRLKNPDEQATLQTSIVADLGIGGLPALLASCAKDYDFKNVSEGKIDDQDVVTIEGTWNAKYLEMWQGPKSKDKAPPPLPVYVPDLVRMSFDKQTEFPRRIEFLKQLPGQSAPSPLMTVDFTKVVFNGKVSRDDFVFIAPERPAPVDITQMYLQRLAPPKKDAKAAAPAESSKAAKNE